MGESFTRVWPEMAAKLSANALRLYVLADQAYGGFQASKGYFGASWPQLAELTGRSPAAVRRDAQELLESGWWKQAKVSKGRYANRYRMARTPQEAGSMASPNMLTDDKVSDDHNLVTAEQVSESSQVKGNLLTDDKVEPHAQPAHQRLGNLLTGEHRHQNVSHQKIMKTLPSAKEAKASDAPPAARVAANASPASEAGGRAAGVVMQGPAPWDEEPPAQGQGQDLPVRDAYAAFMGGEDQPLPEPPARTPARGPQSHPEARNRPSATKDYPMPPLAVPEGRRGPEDYCRDCAQCGYECDSCHGLRSQAEAAHPVRALAAP